MNWRTCNFAGRRASVRGQFRAVHGRRLRQERRRTDRLRRAPLRCRREQDRYVTRITSTLRSTIRDSNSHFVSSSSSYDYIQSDNTHPTYSGGTVLAGLFGGTSGSGDGRTFRLSTARTRYGTSTATSARGGRCRPSPRRRPDGTGASAMAGPRHPGPKRAARPAASDRGARPGSTSWWRWAFSQAECLAAGIPAARSRRRRHGERRRPYGVRRHHGQPGHGRAELAERRAAAHRSEQRRARLARGSRDRCGTRP